MCRPRQVLPGATVVVTRRCAQRLFLLVPSEMVNAIVAYVLAVAANRYGIQVHAFCVLSNHLHIVLTDVHGRLPAFAQYFHSLVGRAINAARGRQEDFWAPNTYSAVTLLSPADVVAKTAYVLANPVAAGLVPSGRDWPGLWSAPESIGGEAVEVPRPGFFFKPMGSMRKSAQLQLHCPPGFASTADFLEQLRPALAALEAEAAATLATEGRTFLGARRVLAQDPMSHPATREPLGQLNPRVACRDPEVRKGALARLQEFAAAYRDALAAWRRGIRDVIFPEGTYQMRVQHAVRCAAPA
ncbi:MAG TPA: hypothetical protein VLT47_15675 [Anaeromyxobacteraceae bacterium]|nr:hypothetical protein [Anaeromyxobacteraceae bacterium]